MLCAIAHSEEQGAKPAPVVLALKAARLSLTDDDDGASVAMATASREPFVGEAGTGVVYAVGGKH